MSDQRLPFEIIRAQRAGARLAAVQAIYEMEQTGKSAKAVIVEFMDDRLGMGPEGEPVEEADPDLFRSIVESVIDHQKRVDPAILSRLKTGWKLTRLDATTRAILRAAGAEFCAHDHLADAVILDEYVSLAYDFFDGEEPKFINALLDNLARDLRAGASGAA